jgi:hypothetical protein
VSPTEVTLNSCNDTANVALVGGSGSYFAASGNSAVQATVSGNTGSIKRRSATGVTASPVSVAFSDGQLTRQVTVNLVGAGAGVCP